jgi:hypothetical protein
VVDLERFVLLLRADDALRAPVERRAALRFFGALRFAELFLLFLLPRLAEARFFDEDFLRAEDFFDLERDDFFDRFLEEDFRVAIPFLLFQALRDRAAMAIWLLGSGLI